ncbi:MAG: 4Fe-4S binding protein [Deltaproteobacteria bacterium]|nr:4Fe-4S binding protein [Deltaproteobacteria bacterium]NNK85013.1 4Fe-4S binding protein [Desulfobacterales bacterium]
MENIYEKLRVKLDKMSIGYPATKEQIEIQIIKQLFNESEAKMFVGLSPFLETSEEICTRLGLEIEATGILLKEMAKKGLLFRLRTNKSLRYAAAPYVPGIYEFQRHRMDKKFATIHNDYFTKELSKRMQMVKTPLLRTIPLNKSLVPNHRIAPYEDVLKIIEGQNIIAVVPCVCRTTSKLIDGRCNKSIENCFQFGAMADYFVENGTGRYVEKDEVKKILKNNEKEGLVMQPYNAKKMGALCSCCGDCCEILRSLKMSEKPVDEVNSNYFARLDKSLCSGCGICLERCQMDAISKVHEKADINLYRCIGCGLCVSTCPEDAILLTQKPIDNLYEPPNNAMETFMEIAKERNLMN